MSPLAGSTDGRSNIGVFVRDLSGPSPTTERVSVSSDEEAAGEFDTSRNPAITGDGRLVAVQSEAQNFTAVPQTGCFSDIFVRDRQDGTTVLASPNGGHGDEASGHSEDPEISAGSSPGERRRASPLLEQLATRAS